MKRISSIKKMLIAQSKDAALCAIKIYNDPNVYFKTETFLILMNVSWTYLLHAYYKGIGIDYRYYELKNGRKKFDKIERRYKYWDLTKCLNARENPIDKISKLNLEFLIGLRNEIEHNMSYGLDSYLSGRYQACLYNYNYYLKKLFAKEKGLEEFLTFSLQLIELNANQTNRGLKIPSNISHFIVKFEDNLSDEIISDDKFSYKLIFTKAIVNHKNQADEAVEFVPANSELGKNLIGQHVIIKTKQIPTEIMKYRPGEIADMMKSLGYEKFSISKHTDLWKIRNAKESKNPIYGALVCKKWYWYDSWLKEVELYCKENAEKFK